MRNAHFNCSNIYVEKIRCAPDGRPGGTSGALNIILSDVRARLRPKAAAWARPGGAHGLGEGQAEPKPSRRAGPRLGLGLGRGF